MSDQHIRPESLRKLMTGEAVPTEVFRRIVAHLEHGCARCQQVVAEVIEDQDFPQAQELGSVLDQAFESALEESGLWQRIEDTVASQRFAHQHEKREAEKLLAEVLAEPPERHSELLQSCRRFQTLALCELLLHESNEVRFHDVKRTLALAELAVKLSSQLDAAFYGSDVIEDLKARSSAQLGNALRLNNRFREAEAALDRAQELAESGSGDPLLQGRLLDLRASVHRDQRRMESARALLDRAYDLYLSAGQPHYAGRTLLNQATISEQIGDPEEAIRYLHGALELIDPELEPRAPAYTRHSLIATLCEVGRPEEARQLLEHHRDDYFRFGDARQKIKLHWVEGKIAAALDELSAAEASFRKAEELYMAEDSTFMWAVVALERATLYAREGRISDVKRLANRVFQTFEALEIHRDAFAALVLLKKAADAETATVALLEKVAKTLLQNPVPAQETPS